MKKLFGILIALSAMLMLMTTALAGAEPAATYTEMVAMLADSNVRNVVVTPVADFGWPSGSTTVEVKKDLSLDGSLEIPANVTFHVSSPANIYVGGKLYVSGAIELNFGYLHNQIVVKPGGVIRPSQKNGKLNIREDSVWTVMKGGRLEGDGITLYGTLTGDGEITLPIHVGRPSEPNQAAKLGGTLSLANSLRVGDPRYPGEPPADTMSVLLIPDGSCIRLGSAQPGYGVNVYDSGLIRLEGRMEARGNTDTHFSSILSFVGDGKMVMGDRGLLALFDKYTMTYRKDDNGSEPVPPASPCVTGTGKVRCTDYKDPDPQRPSTYRLFGLSVPSSYADEELKKYITVPIEYKFLEKGELSVTEQDLQSSISKDVPENPALNSALKAPGTGVSGLADSVKASNHLQGLAQQGADSFQVQMNITVTGYEKDSRLAMDLQPQLTYTKEGSTVTEPLGTGDFKSPVTVSLTLPTDMTLKPNYARHTYQPDADPDYLPVTVKDGVATWQQSSFSPVELIYDDRQVTVTFPDIVPAESRTRTYSPADLGRDENGERLGLFPGVEGMAPGTLPWNFTVDGRSLGVSGCITDDLLTSLCSADLQKLEITPFDVPRSYTITSLSVPGGSGIPARGAFTLMAMVDTMNGREFPDTILAASYDGAGKLLGVQTKPVPAEYGTIPVVFDMDNTGGNIASIKVMILPVIGAVRPLCPAQVLN